MTIDRGDGQSTMPAHVEDLRHMKGMYLRHLRTDKYVKVIEVGREGVTAQHVEPDAHGGEPYGEPHGITWLAIQHLYNLSVDAHEIEGAK